MAVYETHQNRHLYVVNAFKANTDSNNNDAPIVLQTSDDDGTIQAKCFGEGAGKCLYFVYKGKGDSILTTDKIALKNLNYVKLVKAWDMVVPLRKYFVTLKTSVNGGLPKAGEDYVLRIYFRQFFGMSDEDIYVKDACVRATPNMTAQQFYEAMADALNRSFSREVGATKTTNPYLKFVGSASGLAICELPQSWTQGIEGVQRVNFEVKPTTIFDNYEDVVWGNVEDQTKKLYRDKISGDPGVEPNVYSNDIADSEVKARAIRVGYDSDSTGLPNGRSIADLEWFCMGERADQYRMMGYPNYIPTQYLVDPNQQYNVLELHFALTDWGVDSYRSEKDITIVSPDTENGKTALNGLIDAIEDATGLTIGSLT